MSFKFVSPEHNHLEIRAVQQFSQGTCCEASLLPGDQEVSQVVQKLEPSDNRFRGPVGCQIQMHDTVKHGGIREMHEVHLEQ